MTAPRRLVVALGVRDRDLVLAELRAGAQRRRDVAGQASDEVLADPDMTEADAATSAVLVMRTLGDAAALERIARDLEAAWAQPGIPLDGAQPAAPPAAAVEEDPDADPQLTADPDALAHDPDVQAARAALGLVEPEVDVFEIIADTAAAGTA